MYHYAVVLRDGTAEKKDKKLALKWFRSRRASATPKAVRPRRGLRGGQAWTRAT